MDVLIVHGEILYVYDNYIDFKVVSCLKCIFFIIQKEELALISFDSLCEQFDIYCFFCPFLTMKLVTQNDTIGHMSRVI